MEPRQPRDYPEGEIVGDVHEEPVSYKSVTNWLVAGVLALMGWALMQIDDIKDMFRDNQVAQTKEFAQLNAKIDPMQNTLNKVEAKVEDHDSRIVRLEEQHRGK